MVSGVSPEGRFALDPYMRSHKTPQSLGQGASVVLTPFRKHLDTVDLVGGIDKVIAFGTDGSIQFQNVSGLGSIAFRNAAIVRRATKNSERQFPHKSYRGLLFHIQASAMRRSRI